LRPRSSLYLRCFVTLLIVAGIIGAFALRGAVQPIAIKELLGASPWAPFLFILATIAASLVFVPRTMLAVAAGLLFGLWAGVLWATIGSTVGSVLGFLLARYVNAGFVDEARMPRLQPALRAAERGGWRTIALIRLIPVLPNTPVNFALGLTRISLASYALGTLLGQLPMTVVCAELGASGNAALSGHAWVTPTLIGLALLGLTMLLPRLPILRRSLRLGTE
jgi:uncharacterized membrane protein YdjX (TVP38/TMEM64 family)